MSETNQSTQRGTRLLRRLTVFLRAGQPRGAPSHGYNVVLALMRRRLTDDEVSQLVEDFATNRKSAVTEPDIAVAILTVTGELPTQRDVDRVVRRLLHRPVDATRLPRR